MITIVAIGKRHEAWVEAGIELYQKRLRPPYDIKWTLLPHSSFNEHRAREEESERLLSRLSPSDYVLLLDETGEMMTSPSLSKRLEALFTDGKQVVVVIGGAYGVNGALLKRADLVLSLSPLVFPHQLVRLLLTEQFYRAQQIARGGSYHHE